jgi:hypothetical protein
MLENPPLSRGEAFPDDTLAQDVILRIFVTPITSLGETAEIAELLRLFVTDGVSEAALIAHTAREPYEEQMAQSS